MKNNPLVTVNILSFNRKDELRFTLTKVFEQDYKNIEVIVVDNASSDGTREMVKSEFPNVVLIELEKNIGIAGWNRGFEIAKGEYVLVLDDDSYPEKDAIDAGVKTILQDEKIGIVAYHIYNLRLKEYEKIGFNNNIPLMFIGCGALIKRKLINQIGGYNEKIFIYNHEQDFSMRCYNSGSRIFFLENHYVFHIQSKLRPEEKINPFQTKFRYEHFYYTISVFIIQNFDFNRSSIYLLKWILNRLIVAISYLYIISFFKITFKLVTNFDKLIKTKNKMRFETQKLYQFGNHPLIDRDFFPNFRNPFK